MDRGEQIKAFHQSEERYRGLQLEYDGSAALKEAIFEVIDDVTLETGMIPKLYTNSSDSISIEFYDKHDRDGGRYFVNVLGKLGISCCEAG